MAESAVRVLVVENDLFFTARIVSVLERAGYAVDSASSPADALARTGSEPPDLVVIGLGAEPSSELELVCRLKAISPQTRVLAHIPHVKMPEVRTAALNAGVDKLCANSAASMRLRDLAAATLRGDGPREEE